MFCFFTHWNLLFGCLTHWGRVKMAAILQLTSSNAFSWIKVYEFRSRFHCSLFLRVQLTIFQQGFRNCYKHSLRTVYHYSTYTILCVFNMALLIKWYFGTETCPWGLQNYTETEMSSFWWNFRHWLHWKLSKWQLPVQPVIKISSKWRHFRFSVTIGDCLLNLSILLSIWWWITIQSQSFAMYQILWLNKYHWNISKELHNAK